MIVASVIAALALLCCISGFIAGRCDRRHRLEQSRRLQRLARDVRYQDN